MTKFCASCNQSYDSGRFCPKCGKMLEDSISSVNNTAVAQSAPITAFEPVSMTPVTASVEAFAPVQTSQYHGTASAGPTPPPPSPEAFYDVKERPDGLLMRGICIVTLVISVLSCSVISIVTSIVGIVRANAVEHESNIVIAREKFSLCKVMTILSVVFIVLSILISVIFALVMGDSIFPAESIAK
ncbi:MAG TPA: hypothetical protein PKV44_03345 [Bacillota bacterium]|nr:hypothetical protein [Bacillota bacterium]HPE38167.1 hypothetical protein [Bacillota bacterium]